MAAPNDDPKGNAGDQVSDDDLLGLAEDTPGPGDDKKPDSPTPQPTDKKPEKPSGDAKPERIFAGKYGTPDDLEKAFLANQAETTKLMQQHQAEKAESQRLLAEQQAKLKDLEAKVAAAPQKPPEDEEELPDLVEDPDGWAKAQEARMRKQVEKLGRETAEKRFQELQAEDKKRRQEEEERDRYVDQVHEYIQAFHPGKKVEDVETLGGEVNQWARRGMEVGISNITTARRYFESQDPDTQDQLALARLRKKKAEAERVGRQEIGEPPFSQKEISAQSMDQLVQRFKDSRGIKTQGV